MVKINSFRGDLSDISAKQTSLSTGGIMRYYNADLPYDLYIFTRCFHHYILPFLDAFIQQLSCFVSVAARNHVPRFIQKSHKHTSL